MTRTRSLTYRVWHAMRQRCLNASCRNFKNYGGRGIKVCARWNDFDVFVEDMGLQPQGLTLERINNDGDYEPNNCRWATHAEQSRNRRVTRNITLDGKTACITDWARAYGLSVQVVSARLKLGWTDEQAVKTPALRRDSSASALLAEAERLLEAERAKSAKLADENQLMKRLLVGRVTEAA